VLVVIDFFTTEVWTWGRLVTYYVCFTGQGLALSCTNPERVTERSSVTNSSAGCCNTMIARPHKYGALTLLLCTVCTTNRERSTIKASLYLSDRCGTVEASIAVLCRGGIGMERQTLDKLEAAFEAVEKDLSGRVAELAVKSTSGTLSQEETAEYEQIVRLNDLLSLLKLQAEEYWAPRIAS
jgi:hypothetical protein